MDDETKEKLLEVLKKMRESEKEFTQAMAAAREAVLYAMNSVEELKRDGRGT